MQNISVGPMILIVGLVTIVMATVTFIALGTGTETPSVNGAGDSPSVVFDQELADCLTENAEEFYSRYHHLYNGSNPRSAAHGSLAATYAEAICIPPPYEVE